jgi:uncharacterized protein YecE (DUF72 family)
VKESGVARLQVGLPELVGDIAKYASKFDMVELRPVPGAAPRAQTLRAWRRAINPSFTFSVVLPRIVGELSMSKEMDAALQEALGVALAVEARCIVLSTPAEIRPTTAKLSLIMERLPKPSVVLCWEPHGIWERAEVLGASKQLGFLPVFDATQTIPAPGPFVYTRLRSLGAQGVVGERSIQRIAEQLAGMREAWVVVENRASASRVRTQLGAALDRDHSAPGPVIVRPSPGTLRAEDEEQ